MSIDDLIDWFRLSAYFAGECTAEERDALERWMDADSERRRVVQRLRMVWEARSRQPVVDYGHEEAIAHVMTVIREEKVRWRGDGQGQRERQPAGSRRIGVWSIPPLRRSLWYTIATLIIGVVGIAIGWTSKAYRTSVQTPLAMSTYATANAQRANITLLDGTKVSLNVASRLEVPADFAAGNHTVYLTGEGLFTVLHHDGNPFTVVTGSTRARVLGTSFVVRHYPTDPATMVAVNDGKVAVGSRVVSAQRLISVERDGSVRSQNTDMSVFSFSTGTLTIGDTLLPDAIAELDRWYDADIQLGDPSLGRQRIEGKFAAGSLVDLADLLKMVLNVRVVRNDRVLTLYPRQ